MPWAAEGRTGVLFFIIVLSGMSLLNTFSSGSRDFRLFLTSDLTAFLKNNIFPTVRVRGEWVKDFIR